MMRTLPPPGYADQQECTKLRLLLAVTRRRRSCVGTVGSQPQTHEGCSTATQSPSVCVDRQRPNAWQLARSIASLVTVLQSVVATQPAADDGAVCDERTSSAW